MGTRRTGKKQAAADASPTPYPVLRHEEARAVASLERPRVDALFEQASRYTLVAVVAGPGYGKTIAIDRFMSSSPRQSMLLNIGPFDSDIGLIWREFVRCVEAKRPDFAANAARIGFPDTGQKWERVLRLLSEEAISGVPPVTFIIDDYSRLRDIGYGERLEQFANSGFRNVCLMLVSRKKASLEVAPARASSMFQITGKDLAFTPGEVQELYRLRGCELAPSEAEAVWRRTEGWPLAVSLLAGTAAAVVHSERGADGGGGWDAREGADAIAPERLNPGIIEELFDREYYAGYGAEVRRMFIQMSELPFFTLDIMRAAMELPEASPGKTEEAAEALRDNPFASNDVDARLYKLHAMYQAYLAEKRVLVDRADWAKLFFAAGESYASIGCLDEAFEMFHRCGRHDKTVGVIYKYLAANYGAPRELANQFGKELSGVPPAMADLEPVVGLLRAAVDLNNLETDRARELLAALVDRLVSPAADAATAAGSGTQGQDMVGSAFPIRRDALLSEAHCMLGFIHVIKNDELFAECFRRAEELADGGAPPPALAIARKPAIVMVGNHNFMMMNGSEPGALARMEAAVHAGFGSLNRYARGAVVGAAYLFSAEASYNKLEFAAAKRYAWRALYDAIEVGQHEVACNARVTLMRIAYLQTDLVEIERQLVELRGYINEHSLERLRSVYVFAESLHRLRIGDMEHMDKWASSYRAEQNRTPPIMQGRERALYSNYLLRAGRYDELMAHLGQSEVFFQKRGLFTHLLDVFVFRALCHWMTRDEQSAVRELWHAYRMARANDIAVSFVICGSYGRQLVDYARRAQARRDADGTEAWMGDISFDVEWLDFVHRKASAFSKRLAAMLRGYSAVGTDLPIPVSRQATGIRLSKREKDVLANLAKGYTRQDIADASGISVNTAKSTITNVYNKLGAVNRADAVRIAASLGILDDQ